ncbi:MAG: hypothetical protein K2G03_06075, partial [Bacilli bacterium]|nr:hypothetical protein [Bacilli bacterium]
MPRPLRGQPEKSKNFKGSIKRLFTSLDKWRYLLIIALILAAVSSLLSIISPNILSDLTDTITAGMIPKMENIQNIAEKIGESFKEENMNKTIASIMENSAISEEDKITLTNTLSKMETSEEPQKLLYDLPDNILILFLGDFTIEST